MNDEPSAGEIAVVILLVVFFLLGAVAVGMWGCPQYQVYEQRLTGEAELARANYNRQVTIVEAEAKMKSADALGQAEVTRARYLAEANHIIGESLKGREEYLRYLCADGGQPAHPRGR